jgi:hypothetical protein
VTVTLAWFVRNGLPLVVLAHAAGVAQAQLPSVLPRVDAVNASVQLGSVTPADGATVPSFRVYEAGLWGFGVETEFKLPLLEGQPWEGSLGLGYNQLNLDATLGDGRRLRGTLRDLPALSLYLGRKTSRTYFGATIAVSELVNGRLHREARDGETAPSLIKVAAMAFSPGVAFGFEHRGVFVELGYMARFFPSLAYDGLPTSGLPSDLGERMWAGGFMLRVGGRLELTSPPPPPKLKIPCDGIAAEVADDPKVKVDHTCAGGTLSITRRPGP